MQNNKHFLPVNIHNLSGFDNHLFFTEVVARGNPKIKFRVIPKTDEFFITMTYDCLKFFDSMRFLGGILQCLSSSLEKENLVITKKQAP